MALLRLPAPYDFTISTERFRTFGPDLANLWHEGALHRVVGGQEVRIGASTGGVEVGPLDALTETTVLKLLGAEFELEPFRAWAFDQPVLSRTVHRLAGFRPPILPDPFEALVTSITAQQVSLRSALAMRNRLIERLGVRAEHAFAFPTRERVAAASEDELFALGFSHRKAEYVLGLARAELDLDRLGKLGDDEVRASLTAIRGLGPWTAEWFLARHLARPQAWPAGDLVLRRAAESLYGIDVHELGRRLDPFQNLSAHYLFDRDANSMNIRRATEADEPVLRELWEECSAEVPSPPSPERRTWEGEWADVRANVAEGAVYIAEDDEGAVGVAEAAAPVRGRAHIVLVYVRPRGRRQGIAKALLAECIRDSKEKGAALVSLDVSSANTLGRTVWQRLGFEEVQLAMATPLDALERRLAARPSGRSRSATHVQSDDTLSIERALAQWVPRLDSAEVRSTANGWIRIADPLLDTDREAQGRLAKDISARIGGVVVALALEFEAVVRFRLYDNGRMVDHYLSVPTFYGPISKADELALEANPTLVARLTGAERDAVRRTARTAISPADLPPASELYDQIAQLMGLDP